MKIGGLQPVTLLDYPQKVAAIIFTSGCNMRCPFCHNPSLVWPQLIKRNKSISTKTAFAFLKKRKKYLDGVVITGGEPTLQPDLAAFCRQLKALGYLVKLDTNGLRPRVLEKLIKEKLVDYLAMDIKGPLKDYPKFCGLEIAPGAIVKSIELIKTSGLPYEFRSTVIKGWHRPKDLAQMTRLIAGAKKYFLQNFSRLDRLVDDDFSGQPLTNQELERFKKLAARRVAFCGLR
jgi:pyruvate formate lyase activating enzyme